MTDHLNQVWRLSIYNLNTLGFDNASPASKPTYLPIRQLSVCSSQVHSVIALASARTIPDSLSLALKPNILGQNLLIFFYSLAPNNN
jgi:hypothetical protein